jgi:hypothetical protein
MPFRLLSAPVLRTVPDVQDFDHFIGVTVYNNVRWLRSSRVPFTSPDRPRPGKVAGCSMPSITVWATLSAAGRIVFLDAFNSGYKLVGRFGCPPNLLHE